MKHGIFTYYALMQDVDVYYAFVEFEDITGVQNAIKVWTNFKEVSCSEFSSSRFEEFLLGCVWVHDIGIQLELEFYRIAIPNNCIPIFWLIL